MILKNSLSIAIVIGLAITTTGCNREDLKTDHSQRYLNPIEVTVDQVVKRRADNQLEVVGTVEAVKSAEISSKITGNIIALQVDLGSKVTKGQLLIELSAGEISARVQQAKAQLEQELRNLRREESLLKKNATTPKTVKSLQDSTRIAEAAYQETQTMLANAKITAPFTGIVTRKLGNVGDLATPGKPLLYIEEQDNLQIVTDIPEAMILRIKQDEQLPVYVPSAGLSLVGIVSEISPIADPSSRSAPVKLRIGPDPRLRSGQFARVTLPREQAETLFVPNAAVVPFGQIERVFVLNDDKAVLRLVRTGTRDETNTEILSGLEEGETVIVSHNLNLLDGQTVVVQ